MLKSNIITRYFQKIVKNRDIRDFKKNKFYYIFFRLFRNLFNTYIEINIYDFKILASNKRNHTSHALLKKCDFDDQHELQTIKKFSKKNKIFLLDCGANYGFYSFYTASLSDKNFVISFEASPRTSKDFNNNLHLNNFININLKNLAISNKDDENVMFNESFNDWESSLSHNKFKEKRPSAIKTITLDTVSKEKNLSEYFLFIKLDIEGHEFQAIQGGYNIIRKHNPIIIIEFSKYIFEYNKNSVEFLNNFLKNFNYCIYGTNNKEVTVTEIINLLENLDAKHKTIGNYYLIKNNKDIKDYFIEQ